MRVIVLAAGTGSRMGEIINGANKAMLPVNGKILIDYLFDFFVWEYINEVIVIGGYCYDNLKEYLDKKNNSCIKIIENTDYLKGNIFTLIKGLEQFSGDSFLITNVDHLYPPEMFRTMMRSFKDITLMCDFDRKLDDDDMKIQLNNSNGSIKMISKYLDQYDCGYIGMTYVDISKEKIYRNAVEKVLKKYGENAVVENILQLLADEKETTPQICDLSGFGWYEIDTKEDLIKAEKALLNNKNFEQK